MRTIDTLSAIGLLTLIQMGSRSVKLLEKLMKEDQLGWMQSSIFLKEQSQRMNSSIPKVYQKLVETMFLISGLKESSVMRAQMAVLLIQERIDTSNQESLMLRT